VRKLKAGLLALGLIGAEMGLGGTSPAVAAGPPVLLMGDSVMAAFTFSYGQPGLAAVSAGYTTTLNTGICRRLVTPPCSSKPGTSALGALQAYGQLPATIVMTVGHNEKDDLATKIDTIMRHVTTHGTTRVLWLTYQNVLRPDTYAANNTAVLAARSRWPQLRVADWKAYSLGKTAWFSSSDGLHLSTSGALAYGQYIRAQLDALGTPAPPPPPPPPDPRCAASTAIGTVAPPPAALPPDPPAAGAKVAAVTPRRLLDTRAGGVGGARTRLGAGRVINVTVGGANNVPTDAVGAVVNLTIVDPCTGGFALVYPSGTPNRPMASSANFRAGQVVAGLAVTRLGSNGALSVYSSAQTDVIVDLVGYLHATAGERYHAIDPARILDTRPAFVGAGQERAVPIRGAAGGAIPADPGVLGAVLNVTVTEPASGGFVTLYPGPCNPANRPTASTINFARGATIANLVVAALGSDGSVCVHTSAPAKVILDAAGWMGAGGQRMFGITPQRLVDTRGGTGANPALTTELSPFVPLAVTVGPAAGVPAEARAVVAEVTAVGAAAGGFLTVYPCGSARPTTSNVNYAAGEARPNLVAVKVGSADQVCIVSSRTTDVLVDLAGWFA
jgi:hypothetical protein